MYLAQRLVLPGLSGTPQVELEGPLTNVPFENLGDVISRVLLLVYPIAGLILFIMLIWGGYDVLFSGGDPAKVGNGKTRIINALIGFGIVFLAFFLTQTAAFIFGFPFF